MSKPRVLANLALIGFMGSGKSTVGRLAAESLGFEFLDTDDEIERRIQQPIATFFDEQGEPAFRELEHQLVLELEPRERLVIATGGGLPINPANLESLKRHSLVVCLWASVESIWSRVREQTHRPLLNTPDPVGRIRELLAQREKFYRQADVLLNTERRSCRDVSQHVLHQFHLARRAA